MKTLGSARYLGQYDPGADDWTKARARRVGGSEIAAVLGLSPWESPFSLWHRKAGHLGALEDTDLMWWGREMEPVIAKRFAIDHPELTVRRCPTYVHRDRDYQLSSPDRVAFAKGATGRWRLVEIKHAHESEEWGPEDSEDVPIHYRCQVIWQMDTFGVSECYLVVYFGHARYRCYRIRYDEHDALILRKRAEQFVGSLNQNRPPTIDVHPASYSAVREMHPDIDHDQDVDVPRELAEPYLAALRAEKDAAGEKARAAGELIAYMGAARRALYGKTADGEPRSIAARIAAKNGPYLRATPLSDLTKEIA